ncbi:lipase family protein [Cellulomonas massiliensis]|uniref:lipase family protein n=1 Tax=Cellulomonas massiliensis TaxID=1465811 RepID=UPI0003003EB1|nr:lipase family protein [Cellulomonas massiliensis]
MPEPGPLPASLARVWSRAPRWVAASLASLGVLVGVLLVLHPFTSLAVLLLLVVVGLLADALTTALAAPRPSGWALRVTSRLAAAVALAAWPAPSVRVLAVVVGGVLVVDGVTDVLRAVRPGQPAGWHLAVHGLATVLLGLVALAWPDVTVVVVAVAFGAATVVLSARQLRGARQPENAARRPPRPRPAWRRHAGVVAELVGALALVLLGAALARATPVPDAFYAAPARPPAAPGALLRAEPFVRDVPDGARAWRILYTTTRDEGVPAVASAIVVTPERPGGPTPVVAWAHGTTGAAEGCAPSLLDDPFEAGALFVLDRVVAEGWTLVATDYTGLGTAGPHPYLIGQGEARSVLDSVRAARALDGVRLTGDTVVWGHSQGGHAALWTGQLAPAYAPDVPLVGVAALAPAANLPALVERLDDVRAGGIFASYVISAYSAAYPDVDASVVRPTARLVVQEMAGRCLGEPGVLVSVVTALALDRDVWHRDPTTGALGARLRENVPAGPSGVPLLVAQGGADSLVLPAGQDEWVAARCSSGGSVDYRTYPGRGHVELVEAGSPAVTELVAWTHDRLAGASPRDTC